MTEIDTSRGAVKRWSVVRNDSGLGYSDGIAPDKYGGFVDYEAYRALLDRAEKAEAENERLRELFSDPAMEMLERNSTPGQWGQYSYVNGPWAEQARKARTNGERHRIDSSHDISAMREDGTPYRIATFTHADDAAFVESLVNEYRRSRAALKGADDD